MSIEITDEQFKAAGYHRFDGGSCKLNHSDYLWQKRFRNERGETLYFVNCWVYLPKTIGGWEYHGSVMAESTMHESDDRDAPWYTIQMHGPTDIKIMEEFFSRAYRKLEMIPDPHNQ